MRKEEANSSNENADNMRANNMRDDSMRDGNMRDGNVNADTLRDEDSTLDARLANLRKQISVEIPELHPPKIAPSATKTRPSPVRRIILAGTVAAAGVVGIAQRNVLFSSKGNGTGGVVQVGSGSPEISTTTSPSALSVAITGPPHWHAAFGIYVCDRYLADRDGTADPDTTGVHLHNDGLIHVHPFGAAKNVRVNSDGTQTTENISADVNIANFLKGINVSLTPTELKLPAYNDALEVTHPAARYRDGQPCAGTVGLYQFDENGKASPIDVNAPILDKAVLALALLPRGATLPPPPSVSALKAPSDLPPPPDAVQNENAPTETIAQEVTTDATVVQATETTVGVVATDVTQSPTLGHSNNADCSPKPHDIAGAKSNQISVWNTPDESQKPSWNLGGNPALSRAVFQIIDDRTGWIHVRLPVRPNGASGWVRTGEVTRFATPFGLILNATKGELVTCKDGKQLRVDRVAFPGLGQGSQQSPGQPRINGESLLTEISSGSYFIVDLATSSTADGGGFAFGISGFSNVSDVRLRLRGKIPTPAVDGPFPLTDAVISDEAIKFLAKTIYPGTPIDIQQ